MRHRQTIGLLALVGFFVSLYLWLYKIGVIGQLQCGSGSCEYVQTSAYAVFLSVPVAFYGVVGYAAMIVVALGGLSPAQLGRSWPTRLLALLGLGGFAFSVYLTSIEVFVLHALCRWCVASAVIVTAIAAVAVAATARKGR